jgi:ABC-type methionine transport system permease subunit
MGRKILTLWVTVLLMVIIVQLFQMIGSYIEKKTDKRIR